MLCTTLSLRLVAGSAFAGETTRDNIHYLKERLDRLEERLPTQPEQATTEKNWSNRVILSGLTEVEAP